MLFFLAMILFDLTIFNQSWTQTKYCQKTMMYRHYHVLTVCSTIMASVERSLSLTIIRAAINPASTKGSSVKILNSTETFKGKCYIRMNAYVFSLKFLFFKETLICGGVDRSGATLADCFYRGIENYLANV
jgi:hypothetical protein